MKAELLGHTGGAFTGAKQAREGLIESADRGTLLLTRLANRRCRCAPKLLRALQDKMMRPVGSNIGGGVSSLIARSSEQNLLLREVERESILEIMRRTAGNKLRAAQMLGLNRKTLDRKLEEYRAEGFYHL